MNKLSLRERLYQYLLKQHGFVASGDLQRIVVQHTSYTPRTAVRRLEEMSEDGKIEVKYIKGHAYYSAKRGHSLVVEQSPYKAPVAGSIPAVPTNEEYAKELCRRFDSGMSTEQIFA